MQKLEKMKGRVSNNAQKKHAKAGRGMNLPASKSRKAYEDLVLFVVLPWLQNDSLVEHTISGA